MRTAFRRDVLTTGQVARICHVAPRTVSKWFDRGQLQGYRIPGSRDRRIPLDQLLTFMRANGIPLTGLDGGAWRVLIIGRAGPDLSAGGAAPPVGLEVRVAANGFEAGVEAQQFRPHVVLVEVDAEESEAVGICRNIRSSQAFGGAKVVAACPNCDAARDGLLRGQGFEATLPAPYSLEDVARLAEELLSEKLNEQGRSWRA